MHAMLKCSCVHFELSFQSKEIITFDHQRISENLHLIEKGISFLQ